MPKRIVRKFADTTVPYCCSKIKIRVVLAQFAQPLPEDVSTSTSALLSSAESILYLLNWIVAIRLRIEPIYLPNIKPVQPSGPRWRSTKTKTTAQHSKIVVFVSLACASASSMISNAIDHKLSIVEFNYDHMPAHPTL